MSSIFGERSSQPVFFGYCFQTHSGSRKHILVHIFMGFAISRYLALNKPVLSLKVVFWIIHNGFNRVVATPQSHSSSQKEARHIPSHILRAWGPDPNPSETPVPASWHLQLAPTAGTDSWHPQLAPTAGTYSWHLQLAPTAGTYMGCLLNTVEDTVGYPRIQENTPPNRHGSTVFGRPQGVAWILLKILLGTSWETSNRTPSTVFGRPLINVPELTLEIFHFVQGLHRTPLLFILRYFITRFCNLFVLIKY